MEVYRNVIFSWAASDTIQQSGFANCKNEIPGSCPCISKEFLACGFMVRGRSSDVLVTHQLSNFTKIFVNYAAFKFDIAGICNHLVVWSASFLGDFIVVAAERNRW